MRSILILGGSGTVGTHLALRLREKHKVFYGFHHHFVKIPGVTPLPIAMTARDWIKRALITTLPDTIVYAVGQNDLKWCEDHAREAEYAHLGGLGNLTTTADRIQAKIIYLSNAYVFDGKKGNYHPGDVTLPDSVLGKAKVSAENFLKGRSLNWVAIRSAPVLARGNGANLSLLDTLRISLSRGHPVALSHQELHNYTSVEGLIDVIERVIGSGLRNRMIQYGGLTKVSPFELGKAFARRFGFDENLIVEDATAVGDHGRKLDYSLNVSETVELLKVQPLLLEQSFDLIEQHLVIGRTGVKATA